MKKNITIDNKEVRFRSTAATPLRFKAQFGKDYFAEIIKLNKLSEFKEEKSNYEVLENADFWEQLMKIMLFLELNNSIFRWYGTIWL